MKEIVLPEQVAAELGKWKGTEATVWMYHATMRRMAIMVSRAGTKEVLYIVAVGCEHIRGPFHWDNADISIAKLEVTDATRILYRVTDDAAGFSLTCNSSVVLVRDPDGVPPTSFRNFLGDTADEADE